MAQHIARVCHVGQHTRFGDSVIEHVEHVASTVAQDAKAVAWLHELFKLTPLSRETLRTYGLTADEELTLELLTRAPTEPYEEYITRIAHAPGRAGQLARMVKLADLDDHLGQTQIPAGSATVLVGTPLCPGAAGRRCLPAAAA